jgi:hypothetical protein
MSAADLIHASRAQRSFRLRLRMNLIVSFFALCCTVSTSLVAYGQQSTEDHATIIIVVGAAGEEEFGKAFMEWAALWEKAGTVAGAKLISIGLKPSEGSSDREKLEQALATEANEPGQLWLVFIGHGTFDGKEAKFNLRGPDISANDLATWLRPLRRPVAVIDTASASSPFIKALSAEGRVIITATRSGYEQNYARFGRYLAAAITDPQADLDKDGQTSLLEAFLIASRRLAEFYQVEGRLATEHALIDDNGDGLGTPADWFRGIRAVKKAQDGAALDGVRAHQFHLLRNDSERHLPAAARAKRDELELAIAKLRASKTQVAEDEYYRDLEKLMLELAHLYQGVND